MRLFFLFFALFFFSGCAITPEVSKSAEEESQAKILEYQIDAQKAQEEYKKLQSQRDKE